MPNGRAAVGMGTVMTSSRTACGKLRCKHGVLAHTRVQGDREFRAARAATCPTRKSPGIYTMRALLRRSGSAGWLSLVVISTAASAAPRAASTGSTGTVYLSESYQPADAVVGTQTVNPAVFYPSGGSITVKSVTLTGANAASYSISKNTCTPGTVLAPSLYNQCEVDILFSPQSIGALTESLTMVTSVGTQTFDLTASGLPANLLVSPTLMDFGFQPIGTDSATRTLTVRNPNPVAISLPVDLNMPVGNFLPVSGSCDTIAANASCSYQIAWTPRSAAEETGLWLLNVGHEGPDTLQEVGVTFIGQGVQDGATSVDLTTVDNVVGVGYDGGKVTGGGLDGHGNVYSQDFLTSGVTWSGQSFQIRYVTQAGEVSAVSGSTLALPAGPYFGVTLLGTGVNGNQVNQPFIVTYSDGTRSVLHQSLSDWKTPQHYVGESIAVSMAYRLTVDGTTQAGPFNLYAYTLPLDHTKSAVSLTLPGSRNVTVLALNAGVAGVPITADLTGLYNVTAVGVDGTAVVKGGIDHHGGAISLYQFESVPLNELLLEVPLPNVPDAVANVTVPLPGGQYSTLHLDGMAVDGNKPEQTLTVKYQDGTSTAITQSFSDWHTSQKYTHESIALAMAYKLNPDGTKNPGTFNIYQYDIPIDAAKRVSSVVLPGNSDVVFLTVALKP